MLGATMPICCRLCTVLVEDESPWAWHMAERKTDAHRFTINRYQTGILSTICDQ